MSTKKTESDATQASTMDATVGRRVYHLMWDKKLTQTAFGLMIGVEQSGLAKKLRGTRGWKLDEIYRAAKSLGVTVDELMADTHPSDYKAPVSHISKERERRLSRGVATHPRGRTSVSGPKRRAA